MEDVSFDIGGLLSVEEADKLFDGSNKSVEADEPNKSSNEKKDNPTEADVNPAEPEEVSEENKEIRKDTTDDGDGSSPSIYTSIAEALKDDGIFPDFDKEELAKVKTPEDFAELFESAIESRLDERQKRVDSALGNGVEPNVIKMYEQTIQYLDSINDEVLSSESEAGENLRKQLIYNDFITRGYSHEKALKELEKSFSTGSDEEDAKDALDSLSKFYKNNYEAVQEQARQVARDIKAKQKDNEDTFRKMLLEDDVKIGDVHLDGNTCRKIFDAVSKPVYKDPNTGKLLTAVQQFQAEHPLEFLKQVGMWYVLTEGGKNIDGFTKRKVHEEKAKAIKELGRKINSSSLNNDGSLKYVSGSTGSNDPLLSDGWKVGW